ncbi:MAG: hypothetical protein LBH42_08975, partial [Treponema sp.]|nr:hypothetical protein [Treponema sp.]
MRLIYAQKMIFPTSMARALNTCATLGAMLEQGVQATFFPGGRLGSARALLSEFFTELGFNSSYA